MVETSSQWFDITNFMPHGHCYLWNPGLLWSMVIGNGVIALSYFSIPLALMITMRNRRNDKVKWIFFMFSAFIFACGATHVINIIVIWHPNYWIDAGAKLVTATVSAVTAGALWPIVGRAKAYLANQELATENLIDSNQQLQASLSALERQHDDFRSLNRMSGYLDVCNNLDEINKTIVDTATGLWPQTSGALFLMTNRSEGFVGAGHWGEPHSSKNIVASACWAYRMARQFPDAEDQTLHRCEASGCGVLQQKMCYPIIAGGETLGLLHIEGLEMPLEERARVMLPLLVERAAFAIYSMRLQESLEFKSTRDSLTELFNRRYMDEVLQTEIDRAQRNGQPLSLIIFDLDNFKQLNDTHGHEAGDRALRFFSQLLQDSLRSCDTACRFGGEEFVLIMPATELHLADEVAARVRARLESETAKPGCDDPVIAGLTVSAGVAELGMEDLSPETLLQQADRALYQAKETGRNRVVSMPANKNDN